MKDLVRVLTDSEQVCKEALYGDENVTLRRVSPGSKESIIALVAMKILIEAGSNGTLGKVYQDGDVLELAAIKGELYFSLDTRCLALWYYGSDTALYRYVNIVAYTRTHVFLEYVDAMLGLTSAAVDSDAGALTRYFYLASILSQKYFQAHVHNVCVAQAERRELKAFAAEHDGYFYADCLFVAGLPFYECAIVRVDEEHCIQYISYEHQSARTVSVYIIQSDYISTDDAVTELSRYLEKKGAKTPYICVKELLELFSELDSDSMNNLLIAWRERSDR